MKRRHRAECILPISVDHKSRCCFPSTCSQTDLAQHIGRLSPCPRAFSAVLDWPMNFGIHTCRCLSSTKVSAGRQEANKTSQDAQFKSRHHCLTPIVRIPRIKSTNDILSSTLRLSGRNIGKKESELTDVEVAEGKPCGIDWMGWRKPATLLLCYV